MNSSYSRFSGALLVVGIVALLTIDFVEAARPGGGGRSMSRGGPAASGSFQRSRARPQSSNRQTKDNRRNQRQDVRQNKVENRQNRADNRQENVSDRRENRQDVRREVRDDRQEWYEDRWRRGRFVTATSWTRIGCSTVIIVNGVRYYECGGVRYERVYRGTEVTYIIVR